MVTALIPRSAEWGNNPLSVSRFDLPVAAKSKRSRNFPCTAAGATVHHFFLTPHFLA
jgi:hypothetical protein